MVFRKTVDESSLSNLIPDKQFELRNSYLIEMFQVKHIQTIYNIILVLLFVSFLNLFISDFVEKGEINFGQDLILESFEGFHYVAVMWTIMFVYAMLAHSLFRLWATGNNATKKSNKIMLTKCWNTFFVMGMIAYFALMGSCCIMGVFVTKLTVANTVIVLMEGCRMFMKIYSYVRMSVSRVIDGNAMFEGPKFSKYLYFFFSPTLIYQDEYPRTEVIRWRFVVWHSLEFIGVIILQSYVYSRLMLPTFNDFGLVEITLGNFIVRIIGQAFPSTIILLSFFFLIFHAGMNAFAEILRFGDRMYYRDWWNSRSFEMFYRTWNLIVHDWLHQFVYKDCYEHVFKRSKTASAFVTLTVSAIAHEILMSLFLRFFYPVLFIFFGVFGVVLMFINTGKLRNWGNIIFWFGLSFGTGIVFSLYMVEWYARKNCGVGDSWEDYFIPVSWTCNKIVIGNPNWKIQPLWKIF